MIDVAVIENDVVVNIVVESDDWMNPDPEKYIVYNAEHPAAIGWPVVDGVIVDPNPPPEPYPPIIPA